MDDADWAKRYETEHRQRAIDAARRPEPVPDQLRDEQGRVICIDCGDPINPARLAIKPNAARCTDCKSAQENRHHHGS